MAQHAEVSSPLGLHPVLALQLCLLQPGEGGPATSPQET